MCERAGREAHLFVNTFVGYHIIYLERRDSRDWKRSCALHDVACVDSDEPFVLLRTCVTCVIHASGAVLGLAMRYAAVLMDLGHCHSTLKCYSTILLYRLCTEGKKHPMVPLSRRYS